MRRDETLSLISASPSDEVAFYEPRDRGAVVGVGLLIAQPEHEMSDKVMSRLAVVDAYIIYININLFLSLGL
jgi:hypothetical protein